MISRRSVIAPAAAWPLAARAQQPAKPIVGFLHSATRDNGLAGLLRGLADGGYVEGRNFTLEARAAEAHPDRLPGLARELIAKRVAVLVAGGGNGPALAGKAATTEIPVVFVTAGAPVEGGLVASLARPGANVTGIAMIGRALDAKRIEVLDR